ncbi:MAG: microcystin degradation protein MlrC [Saprospiraceae bacterium]|jgi:microcystin degradation protein MlrC
MAKIAVAGWQHETNTFATIKADLNAFERADEWPPLSTGAAIFETVAGIHLPINGAIDTLRDLNHDIVPLLWCSATPCAHVTEHAFETIMAQLLTEVELALPLDGLYLDLHGAMVCEHLEDGEGAILERLRALVGDDLPIAVSLDLHANVTATMVEHASIIDIFRTYPHIDMGETGSRTAEHLHQLVENQQPLYKAYRQLDFLIPLNWGCTLIQPTQSIYEHLPSLVNPQTPCVAFACGFHLSDIYDVGPSVVAYGHSQAKADAAADALLQLAHSHETDFGGKIWPADQGVIQALKLVQSNQGKGPIILADTQDNPGGGGPGDTTGLLQAMVNADLTDALLGVINDSITASQAHALGIGASFDTLLGEQAGLPGHKPYATAVKVLGLSDGSFTATGPMYKGARIQIGLCALLEISGVMVVVSSHAIQVADQEVFKHIGVDSATKSIVALKSSVHFRNDFTEMASHILIVAAPGPVYADPAALHFENIRPTVRQSPRH